MNAEQLKRIANSRYAAMRQKDEQIEELRKDLAQEVMDSTRLIKTVGEYARELTAKDEEIARLRQILRNKGIEDI